MEIDLPWWLRGLSKVRFGKRSPHSANENAGQYWHCFKLISECRLPARSIWCRTKYDTMLIHAELHRQQVNTIGKAFLNMPIHRHWPKRDLENHQNVSNLAKNQTKSLFRRHILFYYNDVRFHALRDVTSLYIGEKCSRNTFAQLQRASYQKPAANTRYLHDLVNSFISSYCRKA
jgi:hypothetical protein